MHRSRWFRLLSLVFAFALFAAACGDDDDTEEETDTTEGEEDGTDTTAAEEEEDGGEEGAAPAETAGFDGSTITVGILTDQTGPVAVIGKPLTNGMEVFFKAYNERNGGVAGKYPIETLISDTKYSPPDGVQAYNATKGDVVMSSILGTPVTLAVLEALKSDGGVAAPASLDSFWAREPNLLPVGAPYQIQSLNGINYAFGDGGASVEDDVLCTFIQDDAYGEAGQAGVDFAAEELGIEVATTVRYKTGTTDFTTQVTELQNADCTVVWLTATPSVTGGALGKAAELGFTPKWYGQSPTWIGALASSPLAPYLQANFTWVSEGTEWGDTTVPGMEQMLADVEEYAPDQQPDVYFVFGYNQASAIASLLEEAVANGDLSGEGLQAALESMSTDFGGLLGDWEYGPADTRTPPTKNSVFKVNPEKPGGLELVEKDIEADFAGDFEFTAREG